MKHTVRGKIQRSTNCTLRVLLVSLFHKKGVNFLFLGICLIHETGGRWLCMCRQFLQFGPIHGSKGTEV